MMLIAFDLGTSCGWAAGDGKPVHGTLNLAAGRFSGGGMRFLRFRNELATMLQGAEQVAFEEVRRHMGVDAAHVYGGLMAVLTSECEARGIPYEGVPVGTIKKHATGKGNASKEQMVAAMKARGYDPRTEDEADALALWHAVKGT